MSAWPRALIFDLDGTLVDSAPDIAAAINAGLVPLGVEPFTVEGAKALIGGGAAVAIKRAAATRGLALSADDEAAVLARFMQTYAEVSAEGRGLYPGAHDLLGALAAEGRGLALCTNKAAPIARIALEALGIEGYFKVVIGAEDGRHRKPHPEPLLRALAPLGASTSEAVMIGDSHADIDAARAAGIRSIAMTYGYSSTPPAELGASALADRLGDIPDRLASLARSL